MSVKHRRRGTKLFYPNGNHFSVIKASLQAELSEQWQYECVLQPIHGHWGSAQRWALTTKPQLSQASTLEWETRRGSVGTSQHFVWKPATVCKEQTGEQALRENLPWFTGLPDYRLSRVADECCPSGKGQMPWHTLSVSLLSPGCQQSCVRAAPQGQRRRALNSLGQQWEKGEGSKKKRKKKRKDKADDSKPAAINNINPQAWRLASDLICHIPFCQLSLLRSAQLHSQDLPTFCISNATVSPSLTTVQSKDLHENLTPYKQHASFSISSDPPKQGAQLCGAAARRWDYMLCQAMVTAPGLQPPRLHPYNHLVFQVTRAVTNPLKFRWRQVRRTHHKQLIWIC